MGTASVFLIALSTWFDLGFSAHLQVFQPGGVSSNSSPMIHQLVTQADETTDASPPRGSPRRDAVQRIS